MSDRPLIVSLLIGLIVVLVIAGVSLLVNKNSLHDTYKKELSKNMSLQKETENLKTERDMIKKNNESLQNENSELKKNIVQLNFQMEGLKSELAKVEKLKDKLEENLKEELVKQEPGEN